MVAVWTAIELMFLLMFYRLPSAVEETNQQTKPVEEPTIQENTSDDTQSSLSSSLSSSRASIPTRTSMRHLLARKLLSKRRSTVPVSSETGETKPLLENTPLNTASGSVSVTVEANAMPKATENSHSSSAQSPQFLMHVASEMVHEEIVVLLAVLFMTMFSQTAIEVHVCITMNTA